MLRYGLLMALQKCTAVRIHSGFYYRTSWQNRVFEREYLKCHSLKYL